ncbi:hypothetical protein L7F22_034831 [Adiantum nelumboides]|nr:hypothetical protein [Adiantum nelumboides]
MTKRDTVDAYCERFWSAFLLASSFKKISFREQIERFTLGLPTEIRDHCLEQKSASIQELMSHAKRGFAIHSGSLTYPTDEIMTQRDEQISGNESRKIKRYPEKKDALPKLTPQERARLSREGKCFGCTPCTYLYVGRFSAAENAATGLLLLSPISPVSSSSAMEVPYPSSDTNVRRDLRLLQSAKLTELIQNVLKYIANNSRKPLLEEGRQQSKERQSEVFDLRRCLYGVVRLLDQQMYDPILNASLQVAGLLGRTFFMPFALIALSMLARIQVLVLQCLHDVSMIYDSFSEWASKKELIDPYLQTLPVSVMCNWDGKKLSLAAPAIHDQHDSVNQGFVEDQHGRKYTLLESPVLGVTAADIDGASNDNDKETRPLLELTPAVNETHFIVSHVPMLAVEKSNVATPGTGRSDNANPPQMSMPEDLLLSNQGISFLPSRPLCKNNLKAEDHCVSVPKKVAYVSVLSTPHAKAENKEETLPLKKQKKDSLFDMLLGLGDDTHRSLF